MNQTIQFPVHRPRRLRRHAGLRRLVRQTRLHPAQLIAPLFVALGTRKRTPVASMPGIFRLNLPETVAEAKRLHERGVGGVLLFGIPRSKDATGSGAHLANGVIQQAVRGIKKALPNLVVMTDVCLCEYTAHGHCGLLTRQGEVDNDATLPLLAETALSHAKAGADVVAPSAMMDGQVGAIRGALDAAGFKTCAIMSYSAKYASALYGPFREAAGSSPGRGDRKGYQMDPPNAEEALREVALDIQEGADIVMVKPATSHLDVLKVIKDTFHWPTAAYHVSGEYALIKAAAARGWVDERRTTLEITTAIRRAGADMIITYYAKELAHWLK